MASVARLKTIMNKLVTNHRYLSCTDQSMVQVEYDMCKKKLEERLLAGLYRHYPQCEGKVVYCEIATPLTNRYNAHTGWDV